jgi:hypothetical protein
MARQVYSSFHYADIWRANVVRKSGTVKAVGKEVGFYDHSLWEKAKTKGKTAIQKLIDDGMKGAGVTIVLIGTETHARPWVMYEIKQSHALGMGMLGIHVNSIKDTAQRTKRVGTNPFSQLYVTNSLGTKTYLTKLYKTYDWIADDGYENGGTWIEDAAEAAGR